MELQAAQPPQRFILTEPRSWNKLSKTDLKTYGVIVLSFMLITLGSIITCSSLAISIIHPMAPLAGGLFISVFGVFLLKKYQELQPSSSSQIQPQPQPTLHNPGEPLGLKNKNAVNCWANAVLQVLFNSEDFEKIIVNATKEKALDGDISYHVLKELRKAYYIYKEERNTPSFKTTSLVDSNWIRRWIKIATDSNRMLMLRREVSTCNDPERKKALDTQIAELNYDQPITELTAKKQEDSWPFLQYFLQVTNFYKNTAIIERVSRHGTDGEIITDNTSKRKELVLNSFHLDLGPHSQRQYVSLEELMTPFFTLHSERDDGYNEISRHYEKPPQKGFALKIGREHRSANNVNINLRANTKVLAPLNLHVSQERFGEEADYKCTWFIQHAGGSTSSGHYIANVLIDGQWWELSDELRRKLTIQEAQEQLYDSTIIYYKKI